MSRRMWLLPVSGILLTLLGAVLSVHPTPFLLFLEGKFLDTLVRAGRHPPPSGRVVLVNVDEASLSRYGQWPWPRHRLAALCDRLTRLGPKAVAIDLMFPEPDRTSLGALRDEIDRHFGIAISLKGLPSTAADNDLAFAQALSRGPFVLGYQFTFGADERAGRPGDLHAVPVLFQGRGAATGFFQARGVVHSIPAIAGAVGSSGFLNASPDTDGIQRRLPLIVSHQGSFYPGLALAAALKALGQAVVKVTTGPAGFESLELGGRNIPLDERGHLLLQYRGPRDTIPSVSASDVLEGKIPAHRIEGKVVVLGIRGIGSHDVRSTPLDAAQPSTEIQATAIDNLLAGDPLSSPSWGKGVTLLLVLLAGGLATWICLRSRPLWSLGLLVFSSFAFSYGSAQVLWHANLYLSPVLPIAALWVIFVGLIVLRTLLAEQQLKAQRDQLLVTQDELMRMMTAIEQAGEIIMVTDPEGIIQYVNPAFETVTGYTRAEALRQTSNMLKSGEQNEAFYSNLWRTLSEGRTWQGPIVNKRKDGSLYTEEATISPVRDEGGRIVNYVAVKRDITEHLRLSEQLRQSQKMEAIGTLAGGIAHDINNILTPITAHAELALMRLPEENRVRHDISQILTAAGRAAALTKQILAASRKEDAGPPVPVNVGALVKETAKFLRSSIPATIDLRVDVDPACGPVLAEPSGLHQVILNLCTNASYAMAEKGGTLTLSLAREGEPLGDGNGSPPTLRRIRLTVSDTGPGISTEVQGRMFEPYFTTKPPGRGTGMGLAMVHGVVTSLGGEIRVFSELGKGATFDVFLPEIPKDEPPPTEALHPVPRGQGEHVLVVDDEFPIRAALNRLLSSLGYRATGYAEAAEALAALRADPRAFDAVLTDYTMPGTNGLDLAAEMLLIRPDLPILLTTGFSRSVDARVVAERGLRGLVMKPYSRRNLGEALRKALDGPGP